MEHFLNELQCVPWFANIGKNEPNLDLPHKQIHSWEEWPGPEDNGVRELHLRQQALHDEYFQESSDFDLEQLWTTIQNVVSRVAAISIPFDGNQDAWHAPNSAVWHAAWTAGLVGLCLRLNRPIPDELQTQWTCFKTGHWPCGWDGNFPKGKIIIY